MLGRNHQTSVEVWLEYASVNAHYRSYSITKRRDYESRLAEDLGRAPKRFHAYIRRKKKSRPPVGPLKVNGMLVSDPLEMSEVFLGSFASVFCTETPDSVEAHQVSDESMDPLWITVDDVFRALLALDPSGSPGEDGVHPEVLRSCAHTLAFPLHRIFVSSILSALFHLFGSLQL